MKQNTKTINEYYNEIKNYPFKAICSNKEKHKKKMYLKNTMLQLTK